jgi:hypothetical protein
MERKICDVTSLRGIEGIASKELRPEVTIRKLSKFSQSEATWTYCKLLANQKRQLSHVPSHEPKRVNAKALRNIARHILM